MAEIIKLISLAYSKFIVDPYLNILVMFLSSKYIHSDIYEIIRIRTITSKEAKQAEGEDITDDMRLAFELRFSRKLFENYRQIDTHKMINYTFIDTTFDETEKWLIVNES